MEILSAVKALQIGTANEIRTRHYPPQVLPQEYATIKSTVTLTLDTTIEYVLS